MSEAVVEVNTEVCIGCGACERICESQAIKVMSDGKAFVDVNLCNGNFACMTACPVGALSRKSIATGQRGDESVM